MDEMNIFNKLVSLMFWGDNVHITTKFLNSYINVTTNLCVDMIKECDFYIDDIINDLSALWGEKKENILVYECKKHFNIYYVFAVKKNICKVDIKDINALFDIYSNFDVSYYDIDNEKIFNDYSNVFTLKFRS